VLRYEVMAETFALAREDKLMAERERGENLDDDAFLAAVFRTVLDGSGSAESERAPYQVAVTVCEDCKRGWQAGGGATVEMSPPAVEHALCDAERIGSFSASRLLLVRMV
jgi:hypothetical protein